MSKYIHLFQTKEELNQTAEDKYIEPWVSYTKDEDKLDYNIPKERMRRTPFTIEATQDGTKVYFRQSSYAVADGLGPLKVEVSTDDGKTWTEVTAAPAEDDVPGATLAELDKGEKAFIRGRNEAYGYFSDSEDEAVENCNFFTDRPCYVYGNIMSLVSGDDFTHSLEVKEYAFLRFFNDFNSDLDWSWVLSKEGEELILPATTLADSCYSNMFNGCTSLTSIPELPATSLAKSCYESMFSLCSGLTVVPELRATTLADNCYESMFSGCTNLTVAPELPATTLASNCYRSMFNGCTSLTVAPKLLATTLANECYGYMFQGCTGLTYAPELPVTTLANNCYSSMFQGCTGLIVAPELPATVLTYRCYNSMFKDCTSLTTAPELPATMLADFCYGGMFNGCTSLTIAPELPAATLTKWCYSSMFKGCTSLVTAPELPAITLFDHCYDNMFYGCTNLSYIKAMFTTTPVSSSYTGDWVRNVKATGTFVKNSAAAWNVTGNNGVPSGWTVETASE